MVLLGLLYHLTEHRDRIAALREAQRVLRPSGILLAASIVRFASALYGLFEDCLHFPDYDRVVARDLAEGQHRGRVRAAALLHDVVPAPEEVAAEIEEAGLRHETTLAIEGVGWLLPEEVRAPLERSRPPPYACSTCSERWKPSRACSVRSLTCWPSRGSRDGRSGSRPAGAPGTRRAPPSMRLPCTESRRRNEPR